MKKINRALKKMWAKLPGVKYPPTDTRIPEGYNPKTREPYQDVPHGYITTPEAAELLHSGKSAARVKLMRLKMPFVLVQLEGKPPRYYWKKKRVLALSKRIAPLGTPEMVADMLTTQEVCEVAGVVRSTVYRAIDTGELKKYTYRMLTEQGRQKRTYFTHEDVNAWVEKRDGSAWARRMMDL